ncbi:hypothetical protein GCM10023328_05810 [Modestobacter marinus]|uniref:Uncharacterized protein n=1 Tax=Modestobacter marinus TaxID=477641 RepID=A0A846LHE1_9ACTN|nr:hypothetical protein [Modestobacter marinus]NIH66997.1 hypothetical protein [Modestobacter marinus]GGL51054.1 hypothetical protein GCM10011589_04150 [Modestobacter marinus]
MRLTFTRMADRRPVETLVERDDGVVFAMRGAGGGADLPHDLVHAVVETQLQVRDGIWGCVADGVVWLSMRHVSGRQPPHAADRSAQLKRDRAVQVQRAEALAGLVGRSSRGEEVLATELAAQGLPRAELAAAATELAATGRRWAALPVGETWVVEWSAPRPARRGGRRR